MAAILPLVLFAGAALLLASAGDKKKNGVPPNGGIPPTNGGVPPLTEPASFTPAEPVRADPASFIPPGQTTPGDLTPPAPKPVEVDTCIAEAAGTLGVHYAGQDMAEVFEVFGFLQSAGALRSGQTGPLTNQLLVDIDNASGETLLFFADVLRGTAFDQAGNCLYPELCFAADCIFAVGSVRAGTGRLSLIQIDSPATIDERFVSASVDPNGRMV